MRKGLPFLLFCAIMNVQNISTVKSGKVLRGAEDEQKNNFFIAFEQGY